MADVPVWVLIVQTLTAGGFGLAGSFIVPASQREARKTERREKAAAVMREKAEKIFAEIVAVREVNNQAHIASVNIVTDKLPDPGHYNVTIFRALDRLTGLISTYYPEGLPIITNGRTEIRKQTDPMNAELLSLNTGVLSLEGKRLRLNIESAIAGNNAQIVDQLELFMVEAVKPYHPNM